MKNKLRIISAFIVALISISVFSVSAGAQGVYANIESISTYLQIPEEFTVTSADIYADQSLTYQVNAVTADNANNLIITSEKTNESEDIFNFKYLDKEKLNSELSNINSGSNTLCGRIYDNVTNSCYKEQTNAIVFNLFNRNSTSNAIAYTVINGQLITVQYISNDGELTVQEKGLFNEIVDSLTVNQLYQKQKEFKLSSVFAKMLPVVIIFTIIIAVLLFVYYAGNVSSKRKSSRQLADKYYDELKNEGLMDEAHHSADNTEKSADINVASTVIEPSEKVRPKDYQGEASVMDTMHKPRLIEDEWEDVDLDKMFALPDDQPEDDEEEKVTDDFESITENPSEYLKPETEAVEVEDYSDTPNTPEPSKEEPTAEPETQFNRADSAKRYAKLFMGSDVEHKQADSSHNKQADSEFNMDSYANADIETEGTTSLSEEEIARLEERHRQRVLKRIRERKGKRRKSRRNTTEQRSASTRPSNRKRPSPTPDNSLFGEFELDNYWDKYRN